MEAVIDGLSRFCAARGIVRVAELTGALKREETDEAELEWAEPPT
jgi:dihydroorotate dehydrogenase (NAD+) catalytic subunit